MQLRHTLPYVCPHTPHGLCERARRAASTNTDTHPHALTSCVVTANGCVTIAMLVCATADHDTALSRDDVRQLVQVNPKGLDVGRIHLGGAGDALLSHHQVVVPTMRRTHFDGLTAHWLNAILIIPC